MIKNTMKGEADMRESISVQGSSEEEKKASVEDKGMSLPKIGIREFLANSVQAKSAGPYCSVGFERSMCSRMAERKTEKHWLAEFNAYLNKQIGG